MIAKKYVFTCDRCGNSSQELSDLEDFPPLEWYSVEPLKVAQRLLKKTGEKSFVTGSSKSVNAKVHFCSRECIGLYFSDFFNF